VCLGFLQPLFAKRSCVAPLFNNSDWAVTTRNLLARQIAINPSNRNMALEGDGGHWQQWPAWSPLHQGVAGWNR